MTAGEIVFKRNIMYNSGGGEACRGTNIGGPNWTADQNLYYSTGPTLASWNGNDITTLSNFQAITAEDLNSANVEVNFNNDDNLVPVEFTPELIFNDPLFDPDGPLGDLYREFEQFDFNGAEREGIIFIGYVIPDAEIQIFTQPEDIIDCWGTTGRFFAFQAAEKDDQFEVNYQWYKDEEPLASQTFSGLNLGRLDFDMSGEFYCEAIIPGLDTARSRIATLYVLQFPEITEQPSNEVVQEGGDVVFTVDASIYGEQPPSYNVDVQWYKGLNNELVDDDRISGAESNYLSIKNVEEGDFGNDYYVVLTGNCGSATSTVVSLIEAPTVDFDSSPADLALCKDEEFSFQLDITTDGTVVSYDWLFDGVSQDENSATITGTVTSDISEVICRVTVDPGGFSYDSEAGSLNALDKPVITTQPSNYADETGTNATFTIVADDDGSYTYEWFKDGASLGVTLSELVIDDIQKADEGDYYCEVTNSCGTTASEAANLDATNAALPTSVELANEFGLNNSPNPFRDETTIHYTLVKNSVVTLHITDINGIAVFDADFGIQSAGAQTYKLDANKLGLNSGVYIYTLTIDKKQVSGKIFLQK